VAVSPPRADSASATGGESQKAEGTAGVLLRAISPALRRER